MGIKWNNIIVIALVIFAATILTKLPRELGAVLSTMGSIGPGHSRDDQMIGFLTYGLMLVTIVAVVKILTHNRQDR